MFRHLYIHLPYCVKKCPYCDFFSVADDHRKSEFIGCLACEIERVESERVQIGPLDTVFIGGGTPTHLSLREIDRLADVMHDRFSLSAGCEWTVETNPESASVEKLTRFRDKGATRVSLGVQSLHDEELRMLGRPHVAADVFDAVDAIHAAGFGSWSADLIFGAAGQTLESWEQTVTQILDFHPPHISAYALMIEPGSEYSLDDTPDRFQADDDLTASQYVWLMDRLKAAGYEHYEVSNYALPGHRCRHNDAYWLRRPYLGLGPSAHSFDGAERWWNVRSIDEYLDRLGSGRSPVEGSERPAPGEVIEETVMLGLRRSEGIRWTDLPEPSRSAAQSEAESLATHGLVTADKSGVRITRDGWPVADMVVLRLLNAVMKGASGSSCPA